MEEVQEQTQYNNNVFNELIKADTCMWVVLLGKEQGKHLKIF